MQSLMISTLIVLVTALSFGAAEAVNDNLSQLERDAKALELYLQDKKDYKKHCPSIEWAQPSLSTYKKTLNSHLPQGCKK
jgi:hypothetical protein